MHASNSTCESEEGKTACRDISTSSSSSHTLVNGERFLQAVFDLAATNLCIYLPVQSVLALGQVCRCLYVATGTPVVWRNLLLNDFQLHVAEVESFHEQWSRTVYSIDRRRFLPPAQQSSESPVPPFTPRASSTQRRLSRSLVEADQRSPSPQPPTPAEVCGLSYDDWKERYDYKELYRYVFAGRVTNWRRRLMLKRGLANAMRYSIGKRGECLQVLSLVIEWQWQGGLSSGLDILATDFARDLYDRGLLHELTGDFDKALSDYVLSHLVSPQDAASSRAVELLTNHRTAKMEQVRSQVGRDDFCFENAYDQVLLHGTMFDRAAFLFQVAFWKGHSYETRLHQYLLCDLLRIWPERLIIESRRLARTPTQRYICEAWLSYDRRLGGRAVEFAKAAIQSLPNEVRAAVERDVSGKISTMVLPQNIDPINRSALPPIMQGRAADIAFAYFTVAFVAANTDEALINYFYHLRCSPPKGRMAVACNNIGSLFYQRNEWETALKWLHYSQAHNPRYFMTYKNIAKCHARMDNRRLGLEQLTKAQEHCNPTPAELYSERSKFVANPLPELAKAMRICPRLSYPYRYRSALAIDQHDGSRALSELDDIIALTLEPSDLALRADFRKELGMVAEAVDDMVLAATLCPTSLEYRRWLQTVLSEGSSSVALQLRSMDGPFGRASAEATPVLPPAAPVIGFAGRSVHENIEKELAAAVSVFCREGTPPRVVSPAYRTFINERHSRTGHCFLAGRSGLSRQESIVLALDLAAQLRARKDVESLGRADDDQSDCSPSEWSSSGSDSPSLPTDRPVAPFASPSPPWRSRDVGTVDGSPNEGTPDPPRRYSRFIAAGDKRRGMRAPSPEWRHDSIMRFWASNLPSVYERESQHRHWRTQTTRCDRKSQVQAPTPKRLQSS